MGSTTNNTTDDITSVRNQIVLEHLSLVKAIAIRVHERVPVHVDLDDLIHAGMMSLISAAEKYDSDKKVAFQSYAKHRIKGAMLDSLRELDWASRDLRRRHKQLEAVTRDLSAAMGRPPTELKVAEKMGMDVEIWRQMAIELRMVGVLSSSSRAPDEEDQNVPESLARADTQPDSICGRWQMSFFVDSAVRTLPVRYQEVLTLYYSNDMTMKEIGGVLGVNESRVSQIPKTALEKMAAALQSAGIHSCAALVSPARGKFAIEGWFRLTRTHCHQAAGPRNVRYIRS